MFTVYTHYYLIVNMNFVLHVLKSLFLRHLCWIVGKSKDLNAAKGIWKKISADALKRQVIEVIDENLLSDTMRLLDMNDKDGFDDKSALPKVSLRVYIGPDLA